MTRLVPLTKIFMIVAVSLAVLFLQSPPALFALFLAEVVIFIASGVLQQNRKALLAFVFFAILLGVIQYLGGGTLQSAYVAGLRMLALAGVFLLVLTTTRLQDLTAAVVTQLHIPYEYAFMFTAALRFVPDFLAENKAVLEAQACRGVPQNGHYLRRSKAYLGVVQPLVLKSLARSETMALSLELRGFGAGTTRFTRAVTPQQRDYLVIALLTAGVAVSLYLRLTYGY